MNLLTPATHWLMLIPFPFTWCHVMPWGQHFHISILGPKNIILAEKRWNKYKLYIIQNEKVLSFCYELKILWNPSSIPYHFYWNSWKLCFKCHVVNKYGQNRRNMPKKTIHSFSFIFFPKFWMITWLYLGEFALSWFWAKTRVFDQKRKKVYKFNIIQNE